MAEHSLVVAREAGYRAMQFSYVVETNDLAVRLCDITSKLSLLVI